MVYFNQVPNNSESSEETTQWGRVLDFRKQFPNRGLCWKYTGEAQFEDLLRSHLSNFLREKFPVIKPDSTPAIPERDDYFAVQTREIAEWDRIFVGRTEIQGAFDRFLKTANRGYFIVRGGPGQGKTALSCHLINARHYPHHVIRRSQYRSQTR